MGLIQFSLLLVMAVLDCGYTHFVCFDNFSYFFFFQKAKGNFFQQCLRFFDTYTVSFYYATKTTQLSDTEASRAPYLSHCDGCWSF